MNSLLFLSYIITASAIIATPGPSSALMISHSISYGKRAVVLNSAGSAIAASILIGISLFLVDKAIPAAAMPFLSLAGSAYLIYAGITTIRKNTSAMTAAPPVKAQYFFAQAFLTGISNPKDILFFLLFMPQFIDSSLNYPLAAILLATGWIACDVFIMSCYGLAAAKAGRSLSSSFTRRTTKLMGFLILTMGSMLAYHSLRELAMP